MKRLLLAVVVSLLLGVLALYLIAPDDFSRDAIRAVDTLTVRSLSLIVAVILAGWLLAGLRINYLTRQSRRSTNLLEGIQTHVMGSFSAAATPAGGGNSIGITLILHRFGLSFDQALAVAVMCMVGDLAFFAWAVPTSFFVLKAAGVTLPFAQAGLLVTVLSLLAIGLSYLLVFRLPVAIRLVGKLSSLPLLRRFKPKIDSFLADLQVAGAVYSARPWHWHLGFHVLSALARVPYFLVLNLVVLALAQSANHVVVYASQVVFHAFAFLVPTPGASGYQEGVMSLALRGHVSSSSLSMSILLWRIFQHYIYLLIGPVVGGLVLLGARRVDKRSVE